MPNGRQERPSMMSFHSRIFPRPPTGGVQCARTYGRESRPLGIIDGEWVRWGLCLHGADMLLISTCNQFVLPMGVRDFN